jgi:hypothetical protein
LRACTTCSSTIDALIAIKGIDSINAIFSLSTVSKLSVLFVAGPDFQWNSNFNGIQYWRLQRYSRNIFNVDRFHSKLPALFAAGLLYITNFFGDGELRSVELMRCTGNVSLFNNLKTVSFELGTFWIFRDRGKHQVIQNFKSAALSSLATDHVRFPEQLMNKMIFLGWSLLHTTYIEGTISTQTTLVAFRISYIDSIKQEFWDTSAARLTAS